MSTEEHSALISVAWKWLGEDKIYVKGIDDYKRYSKDKYSDESLIKEIWHLFDEADILVGHNAQAFDNKEVNARFAFHGMEPPSHYRTVDTLKEARKTFKFESNKLDALGEYLGLGRKVKHPGIDMWLDCMKGDKKAWKLMKKYNAMDVELLEKVYLHLRPWMATHPNLGVYSDQPVCRVCGSKRLQYKGPGGGFGTNTNIYKRFRCLDCKHNNHGTAGINEFKPSLR